jgi:hypothetical protein
VFHGGAIETQTRARVVSAVSGDCQGIVMGLPAPAQSFSFAYEHFEKFIFEQKETKATKGAASPPV